MSWSDFTKSNILLFKPHMYSLDNNNILLQSIKNDRYRIKSFIKKYQEFNLLNINVSQLFEDKVKRLDIKIKEYSDVFWVDKKGVLNDIDNLNVNYKIEWNTILDNISDNNDKPNSTKTTLKNTIFIKTTEINIKSILLRIKFIIWFIEYLKHKTLNTNKQLKIYLVLSNLKKEFPINKEIIGIKNVNTGYTDFRKNIIFIWRYEEFEKVLLHEIIHYFDMDSRDHHVNKIVDIHANGPHSYYEAITDVWGIYYHLIYLSLITKKSIKILLSLELSFIRNQAMILNEYMELGNWKDQPNKLIKQKTAAFSYYILKYLIFEYLLNNKYIDSNNYNELLRNALQLGFKIISPVKINSSRMTLFQLK